MNALIITAAIAAYMAVGFVFGVLACRHATKNCKPVTAGVFNCAVIFAMIAWPLGVFIKTVGTLFQITYYKFVEKR